MTLIAGLLVALTAVRVALLWADYRVAFFWIEPLATAEYVWSGPVETPLLERFWRFLDWFVIDPGAQRVRPLNDLAEVVDALARPTLTVWFGPHPSLTPSSVLTAIYIPVCLFLCARRLGLERWSSLLLVAWMISSAAYLSVFMGYIRPAKKLSLALGALSLGLLASYAHRRDPRVWVAVLVASFVSMFADEANIILYGLGPLLFPGTFFRRGQVRLLISYAALFGLFVVTSLYVLPFVYSFRSAPGMQQWSTTGTGDKLSMLHNLADPRLYQYVFVHGSRGLLTSLSLFHHDLSLEIVVSVTSALVIGILAVAVWRRAGRPRAAINLVGAYLAYWAMAGALTFVDTYPDIKYINDRSYLASYTYYYHSILVLILFVTFAYLVQAIQILLSRVRANATQWARAAVAVACVLGALVVYRNLEGFQMLNDASYLMMTRAFDYPALFGLMSDNEAALLASTPDEPVPLVIPIDHQGTQRLMDALKELFGEDYPTSDFYEAYQHNLPPWTLQHVESLVRIYFPRASFTVSIAGV